MINLVEALQMIDTDDLFVVLKPISLAKEVICLSIYIDELITEECCTNLSQILNIMTTYQLGERYKQTTYTGDAFVAVKACVELATLYR